MPKKNIEENLNENIESLPEATKPVKTGRKVFKDNTTPTADVEAENLDATVPVKAKSKTRKPAQKTQEPESESQPISVEAEQSASAVTEPVTDKPVKVRHAKWVWLGILLMLVITAIGAGIGYSSAVQARKAVETNQRLELATTQFVKAERDFADGNYDMANQRLQYIMTIYPSYPGLEDKLKEVIVAKTLANPNAPVVQATPEVAFTPVATKDTTVVSVLFPQAQNQFAAGDWAGLLDTVNKLRNIDPSYEALKVDGLYYAALIKNGVTKIQSGHLELGLYYFAMASKIAPLDNDTLGWINMARSYLIAGSWFGIDNVKSAELFSTVAQQVPNMLDVSGFTAKQRYVDSIVGIGDDYDKIYDYCNAAVQYSTAKDILSSDELLLKLQQAQEFCTNPAAAPIPTVDPNAPTATTTATP